MVLGDIHYSCWWESPLGLSRFPPSSSVTSNSLRGRNKLVTPVASARELHSPFRPSLSRKISFNQGELALMSFPSAALRGPPRPFADLHGPVEAQLAGWTSDGRFPSPLSGSGPLLLTFLTFEQTTILCQQNQRFVTRINKWERDEIPFSASVVSLCHFKAHCQYHLRR